MDMNHTTLQLEDDIFERLLDTFKLLSATLSSFDSALSKSVLPISLPQELSQTFVHADKVNYLRNLYTDVWHTHHGDGRRTESCYGLVGADQHLLTHAHKLNEAKDLFRMAVSAINKSAMPEAQKLLNKRSEKLAQLLHTEGLGRLHLKQCYRHIPILTSRPESVRFSWYTSGRSITRLTASEAMKLLLKLDTSQSHIVKQIEKLSAIKQTTMMARIQTQAPVIRANMVWAGPDKRAIRAAKNSPLPLIVPLLPNDNLPTHNHLSLTPPTTRSRSLRSDTIIDPEPFLPSLRIHLYKK